MNITHTAKRIAFATSLLLVATHITRPEALAGGGTSGAAAARAQTVRLRSFRRGLIGSIHPGRASAGGKLMLTAMNLPPPEAFAPGASSYVAWAVRSGSPVRRLGELQPGASGNGGIEFALPWQSDSFTILVTAEPGPAPPRPAGAIALASRIAGAQPPPPEDRPAASDVDPQLMRRLRRRLRSRASSTGYFREVESAIDRMDGGRFLALAGDEAAPRAYGAARAAAADRQAFVHALVTHLPAMTMGTYVLWAVEPGGRMIYMGSVPRGEGAETELHARVVGVGHEDYDLVVTTEARHPAAVAAGRRALSTRHPDFDPTTGMQGFSIKKKQ